jgi:hypothetical protein
MEEILVLPSDSRGGDWHNLSKKNATKSMAAIERFYYAIGKSY